MVEIIAFFASITYAFVIQHFSAPFMVIMNFYAGISVINLNITNFIFFWHIKPCQVEKCDSACDSINLDQAESFSPVPAKNTPRRIRLPVSHTSKSIGASLVVGKVGKDVFLRRTLAYSTTYGTGVFCLMEEGEQQIGWEQPGGFGCCLTGILFAKLSSQNWQWNFKNNGR